MGEGEVTTTTEAHSCTTHGFYRLSCENYAELFARADGWCDRCGRGVPLNIDHDHSLGMAAVRGMVCHSCNTRLGRVDSGELDRDARDDHYLANAWHIGRDIPFVEDGSTKVRTVRVDDELWKMAQEKAKRRRETVAAVLKRALLAYVEEGER